MVYGFSRLKGEARSMDIWSLILLTRKVIDKLDRLAAVESKVERELSCNFKDLSSLTSVNQGSIFDSAFKKKKYVKAPATTSGSSRADGSFEPVPENSQFPAPSPRT